jgi:hypothetical protein
MASEAAYKREVPSYYGTPESMASGGLRHFASGDVGTAVFLSCKSIDMLHTAYGYLQMRERRPSQADEPIIDAFCAALSASLAAHPDAALDAPVREVTHRLRSISTTCEQQGLPSGIYRNGLDRLGAIAPRVRVDDILWT